MARLGAIVLVSILALLVWVAPAAGAFQVKASKRISGPLAIAQVDAKCPRGTQATGGGFRETPPSVDKTFGVVYESRKIDQRTWRSSVQLADKGPSAVKVKVVSFAYCRAGALPMVNVSKTVTLPGSNRIGAATARCPKGKVALAGGFQTPPPGISGTAGTRNEITASARKGKKGWRVQAVSGVFGPASHTAYAYCAPVGPESVRSGKGKVRNPANATRFNRGTAISKPCPRRQSLLSGGFKQSPITFDPFKLTLAYPFASIGKGKRWKAGAVQAGGTTKPAITTLRAIAYCG
jgi:hypothetical protein